VGTGVVLDEPAVLPDARGRRGGGAGLGRAEHATC
jgi:hypothetical protein